LLGHCLLNLPSQKLRGQFGERDCPGSDETIVFALVSARVEHATGFDGNEPASRDELKTDRIRVIATDDMHLFTEGDQQVCNFFPGHHWILSKLPVKREIAEHALVEKQFLAVRVLVFHTARHTLILTLSRIDTQASGGVFMFTSQQWILLMALFVPMLTLLAIVWVWRWVRGFQKERAPVSEKLLRPAGESLRRELEKLDEQLNDHLIWTFFGPGFVTAFLVVSKPVTKPGGSIWITAIALVIGAAWYAWQVWKMIGLIQQRRNYRLGFAGERAVAEELNQLMLDGCRIFHDVPMEPYGNVDHVIVAPSGIYAVETKARRKRKAPPGKRDHEIVFDGDCLSFPECTDTKAIRQAKQQGDRLQAFLSKAVGESVKVRPILTFPGWFVATRSKSDMKVLNPKNIRSAVLDDRLPVLPEQLRQRIIHQLDQKCRDVEF